MSSTEPHDPRQELDDFGALGERFSALSTAIALFFWKRDHYNKEMENGSDDPADPNITTRFGTLMLAEDYQRRVPPLGGALSYCAANALAQLKS